MKWLTIEYIKTHSRLDFCEEMLHGNSSEDDLLELYANSAEETILSLCRTTVEELVEEYGEIPAAIRHASLLLVDISYQYRSPVTVGNISLVPYTFETLIKPYMKLV